MSHDFQSDIELVGRIAAVPTILDVICGATGMGFAAVARVTDQRWVACGTRDQIGFGLAPGGELKIETTFCLQVRQNGEPVVIDHVAAHPDFNGHPVSALYGFESYISVPIRLADGRFFGTLCAVDPQPRALTTPVMQGMFQLFAEMIGHHIDTQERLTRSEAALGEERATAQLREQFIAVLGHDLRNPLASIAACLRILDRRLEEDAKAAELLGLAHSSVRRMSGLVDDMMDLARGQLASGIPLLQDDSGKLEDSLRQVVAEAGAAAPTRSIEAAFDLREPVICEPARIAQLCSNLLANAVAHGAADQPVRFTAVAADGILEVSVANGGEPIPPAALDRLFQPYFRAAMRPGRQGLGLESVSADLNRKRDSATRG